MGNQSSLDGASILNHYSTRFGQRLAGSRNQVASPAAAGGAQSSKPSDPAADANSDLGDKSTAAPDVDTHSERVGKSTADPAVDTPSKPAEKSIVDSIVDTRHDSNKVKIELGSGSITGALTLTAELGDTGLGPSGLAFLKSSATAKAVTDWSRKFETTLIAGKLDADIFDGVKVELEAKGMTVTAKEGETPELLSIGAKLSGDITHRLGGPPGVKVTLDGSIKVALGGKLAAQLSSFVAAQAEEQIAAAEAKAAGEAIDRDSKRIKALREGALKDKKLSRKAIQEIEEEVSQLKVNIHKNSNKLKELAPKLKAAGKKADRAVKALKGKTAEAVGWAIRKAGKSVVARTLMKLVPILNVVSTILDIIETYEIFKALLNGEYGGDGGESSERPKGEEAGGAGTGKDDRAGAAGGQGSESGSATDVPNVDDGREAGPQGAGQGASPDVDEKQKQEAIKSLHPSARRIVDALSVKSASGSKLTVDQVKMIGLLVPQLSAKELETVMTMLRENPQRLSGEEAIIAIDQAVREIRNQNATVKVDGQDRPDIAHPHRTDGPVTSPSQVQGPVTSPAEVDDAATEQAPVSGEMRIVQQGPEDVIGQWFVPKGDELVLSNVGEDWRQQNANLEIARGVKLLEVQPLISNAGEDKWRVEINFVVQENGKVRTIPHVYRVTRGGANGVKVGALSIEKLYKVYVEFAGVKDDPAGPLH